MFLELTQAGAWWSGLTTRQPVALGSILSKPYRATLAVAIEQREDWDVRKREAWPVVDAVFKDVSIEMH